MHHSKEIVREKILAAVRQLRELEDAGVGGIGNPNYVVLERYLEDLTHELMALNQQEFDDANRRLRETGAVR